MATDLMQPGGGLTNSKLALATASVSDVLSGKTFYSGDKNIKTGAMVNRGAWNSSVAPGSSVTVPQGYHNGAGKVTANKPTFHKVKVKSLNVSVHGSGATWPQSVDCKSISGYKNLTTSNFAVQMTRYYMGTSESWSSLYIENIAYTPSTGILKFNVRYAQGNNDALGNLYVDVICYYAT